MRLETLDEAKKPVVIGVQLEPEDEIDKIMRSTPRRQGRDLD